MNDFEYIKILSKKEITEFVSTITLKSTTQSANSKIILEENKNLLLAAYNNFETSKIQEYQKELETFNNQVLLWNKKECICGSKLRFNDLYGFWGCVNYYDKEKSHITYSKNQEEKFSLRFENIKVRLGHNWSTEILKSCNLQNKIKAKELLLFYNSKGLEDLREKYGYKNSIESISGYVFANINSKKEEEEIMLFFDKFFDKVSYQVYIKFKKKGELEKVRIIDLLISDNENVYLIEIKRHNIYINEHQLDLYHELIKRLMESKKDKRKLKSLFVVNEYYESQYNQNTCVEFEKIKLLNDKIDVVRGLDLQVYK